MGIFGYAMLVSFILVWVVLVVMFLRMTRASKEKDGDEGDS